MNEKVFIFDELAQTPSVLSADVADEEIRASAVMGPRWFIRFFAKLDP